MIKLFENYVWGMGQYIANYEFVQFVNYELPFKVPQNFPWWQYFVPYVKNLLAIGKKPGDIDYLIYQAKTVLVNNALSYNFGMVALNYFQRFHTPNETGSIPQWLDLELQEYPALHIA